jgi:hypothetical protein
MQEAMHKRAPTPRPPAVEYTDEQLALAAEGSGLTVDELRALLEQHPMTAAEVADAERFFERARQGKEKLTHLKL